MSGQYQTDPECTLFVGDLSSVCTQEDLRQAFSAFGTVVYCRVQRSKPPQSTVAFGFVSLSTREEAEAARDSLNGTFLAGRKMRIRSADQGVDETEQGAPREYALYIKIESLEHGKTTEEGKISEIFSVYGDISDICLRKMFFDQVSGLQRGYGFVNFSGLNRDGSMCETMLNVLVAIPRRIVHDNIVYVTALSNAIKAKLQEVSAAGGTIDGTSAEQLLAAIGGPSGSSPTGNSRGHAAGGGGYPTGLIVPPVSGSPSAASKIPNAQHKQMKQQMQAQQQAMMMAQASPYVGSPLMGMGGVGVSAAGSHAQKMQELEQQRQAQIARLQMQVQQLQMQQLALAQQQQQLLAKQAYYPQANKMSAALLAQQFQAIQQQQQATEQAHTQTAIALAALQTSTAGVLPTAAPVVPFSGVVPPGQIPHNTNYSQLAKQANLRAQQHQMQMQRQQGYGGQRQMTPQQQLYQNQKNQQMQQQRAQLHQHNYQKQMQMQQQQYQRLQSGYGTVSGGSGANMAQQQQHPLPDTQLQQQRAAQIAKKTNEDIRAAQLRQKQALQNCAITNQMSSPLSDAAGVNGGNLSKPYNSGSPGASAATDSDSGSQQELSASQGAEDPFFASIIAGLAGPTQFLNEQANSAGEGGVNGKSSDPTPADLWFSSNNLQGDGDAGNSSGGGWHNFFGPNSDSGDATDLGPPGLAKPNATVMPPAPPGLEDVTKTAPYSIVDGPAMSSKDSTGESESPLDNFGQGLMDSLLNQGFVVKDDAEANSPDLITQKHGSDKTDVSDPSFTDTA